MWSHTEILLLVAVVATIVFLVAQQAGVEADSVVTAELGRHFTCDVDLSNENKQKKNPTKNVSSIS